MTTRSGELPGPPADGKPAFGLFHVLFALGLVTLALSFGAGLLEAAREGVWPSLMQDPRRQGQVSLDKGDLERAVGQFRMAALIDPSVSRNWYGLGQALYRLGRIKDAEAAWARCVELEPGFPPGWAALGEAAHDRGDLKAAEERYTRAIALDARNAAAHNGIGVVLASLHRIEEAIPHFERAFALTGEATFGANLERARAERAGTPSPAVRVSHP